MFGAPVGWLLSPLVPPPTAALMRRRRQRYQDAGRPAGTLERRVYVEGEGLTGIDELASVGVLDARLGNRSTSKQGGTKHGSV